MHVSWTSEVSNRRRNEFISVSFFIDDVSLNDSTVKNQLFFKFTVINARKCFVFESTAQNSGSKGEVRREARWLEFIHRGWRIIYQHVLEYLWVKLGRLRRFRKRAWIVLIGDEISFFPRRFIFSLYFFS